MISYTHHFKQYSLRRLLGKRFVYFFQGTGEDANEQRTGYTGKRKKRDLNDGQIGHLSGKRV